MELTTSLSNLLRFASNAERNTLNEMETEVLTNARGQAPEGRGQSAQVVPPVFVLVAGRAKVHLAKRRAPRPVLSPHDSTARFRRRAVTSALLERCALQRRPETS
jgi:hypothetical protein